jgi:immune inhibitor A
MRKLMRTTLACVAVGATIASLATPVLGAPPVRDGGKAAPHADSRPGPLSARQEARRKEAMELILSGKKAPNADGVVALAGDKYYQAAVTGTGHVFTILAEFGDQGSGKLGTVPGPLHNQIAKPNRPVVDGQQNSSYDPAKPFDNSTIWTADFNRAHYMDLFFGGEPSFRHFYESQSSGAYTVAGDVTDWVQVPGNASTYGDNTVEDLGGTWQFLDDAADAWYTKIQATMTPDQINAYLAQFDVWDRYDHDNDGNFDEPDGYIDHFQAIHAGEGEEAGGGAQGTDAIWSHRWYAYSTDAGKTGPEQNKLGGVPLGNSGIWIGDYTTEPENGGLGVFAHEFGHDLGLPDLYDTNGGDNGTAFWTLMSGGSWLNHGTDSIGTTPGYMGPWEKLQLGWLDYKTVPYGTDMTVKLGPADKASNTNYQALVVPLPERTVSSKRNTPHSGSGEWWSGYGDNLNATLSRTIDLTGATTSASVDAWVQGNLEVDYDYLYGEVSADNGATWTQVGSPVNGVFAWAQKSFDLSAYKGKSVQFRFRVATDGGVSSEAFVDDVTVKTDGVTGPVDDVESGAGAWKANGFSIIDGTSSKKVQDVYFAENRVYSGYDKTLQTGPYNFGWGTTKPDWVERFPYQNGMLVWFANGEYADNNTKDHPGGGEVLPVDARPAPVMLDGNVRLGNRRQPFDATFGQERTDAVTFHRNGVPTTVPSQPAIPTFDDRDPNRYWSAANPWASTKVAGSGTTMTVAKTADGGNELQVMVKFK